MTTFFTLLGVIAFLVIVKFVYDTFLTGNTEKNWETYKHSNPEEAARIERNDGLNFSTKPKSKDEDKEASLSRLAASQNCSPLEIKLNLFRDLAGKERSDEDVMVLVHQLRQRQYIESKDFNIDPSDTSGAILEEWVTEFFDKKEYANRNNTSIKDSEPKTTMHENKNPGIEDLMDSNAEFKRVMQGGNKADIERFLDDNPELMGSVMRSMAYADEPAEQYRLKAIDKLYEERNAPEAILLINKGLRIHEPQTTPFLYNLRAQCYQRLSNNTEALSDISKAIDLLIKQEPDNHYTINTFLKERAEIKKALGDLSGAAQDERTAKQHYLKYEANKPADDDDNDLPF